MCACDFCNCNMSICKHQSCLQINGSTSDILDRRHNYVETINNNTFAKILEFRTFCRPTERNWCLICLLVHVSLCERSTITQNVQNNSSITASFRLFKTHEAKQSTIVLPKFRSPYWNVITRHFYHMPYAKLFSRGKKKNTCACSLQSGSLF